MRLESVFGELEGVMHDSGVADEQIDSFLISLQFAFDLVRPVEHRVHVRQLEPLPERDDGRRVTRVQIRNRRLARPSRAASDYH